MFVRKKKNDEVATTLPNDSALERGSLPPYLPPSRGTTTSVFDMLGQSIVKLATRRLESRYEMLPSLL